MALVKCKACEKEISAAAKTCPQCGHPLPKKTSKFTLFVAFMIALFVIKTTFYSASSDKPKKTSAQIAIEKQNNEADFKRQDAARRAAATIKSHSKNPASVKIEAIVANADATLVCAIFRATNSFNAVVPGVYVMKNGKSSFEGKDVNRECGKDQAAFDMMFSI